MDNIQIEKDVPGNISCIEVRIYVSEETLKAKDPYLVVQQKLKPHYPSLEDSPLCGFCSYEDVAIFHFFDIETMLRELSFIRKILSK